MSNLLHNESRLLRVSCDRPLLPPIGHRCLGGMGEGLGREGEKGEGRKEGGKKDR